MIAQSVWLMTVFDCVIIVVVLYSVRIFLVVRQEIRDLRLRGAYLAVLSGLSILALFYLIDLLAMHVLPRFIPTATAMAFMESLHLNYRWTVALIAVGLIALGTALSSRRHAALHDKLRKSGEALRQSEERFRAVVNHSPTKIHIKDLEGRYLLVNKEAEELFGVSDEDARGRTSAEIFPKERAEAFAAHDRAVIEAGRAIEVEEEWVREDGVHTFLTVKFPIRDASGKAVAVGAIGTDITERKHAEEALRESEDRLRRSVLDAPIPIMMHAEGGEVLMISKKWTELSGYSHADIPTILDWTEKAYGADKERVRDLVSGIYEIEEPFEREAYVTTARGERRTWDFRTAPLGRLPDGRRFVISMVTDITERKRAEEALRESEVRFRNFAETASDWFWETDMEQRFTYYSGAGPGIDLIGWDGPLGPSEKVNGWTRREMWGELQGRDLDVIDTIADYMVRGAAFSDLEISHRDPERGLVHISMSGKPVTDDGGNVVAYRGTGRNITERKQVEDSLRKLSRVIEQSPASIMITDCDGNIEYVNPAFTKITDYTIDEVRGRNPRILQSGETPIETYQALWDTIKSGRVWTGELLNTSKNGRIYSEFATISPVFNNDGTITNYVGILEDITKRKQAEDALRGSEAQAKAIVDTATDAVVTIDEKGFIIKINHAGEDMFGYTAEEVVGQKVNILMPDPHRAQHDGYIANYLNTGIAKIIGIGCEVEARRRDGSVFPVDLAISEVPLDDRRLFTAFIRDITERKAAEAQLRRAQKMEAVGQLTGGVAHDFNNLLGIILGNAQLLEGKLEDDDVRELLDPVIQATRRGAELTSRLLAFSRQQPLNPQTIDIGELCTGMRALLRRTLGETIEIDLRIGGLSPARADPGQLENALLNLALNARDAMLGGGKLVIETENVTLTGTDMEVHPEGQPGDYVVLKVSDSGTGMAPDVLEKVFEPFFTTKEVGAGSGLGLSMVYGFAQQSGGHVTIESEEGHGTTVAVYLPQAEAAAEDAQGEAADEAIPKGRGETILVVEDEPALRRLTVRQLEGLGYKVLQAPDGPTALEVLANALGVDLLFSDVVLPGGMTGPEICQRARERCPDLRCLFMSGYAVTPEGTLPDGVDLLNKPFEIAGLAQKLRSALVLDGANRNPVPLERVIGWEP